MKRACIAKRVGEEPIEKGENLAPSVQRNRGFLTSQKKKGNLHSEKPWNPMSQKKEAVEPASRETREPDSREPVKIAPGEGEKQGKSVCPEKIGIYCKWESIIRIS